MTFTEIFLSTGVHFFVIEPKTSMETDQLLSAYKQVRAAVQTPVLMVTDQQDHQVRSALMRAHIGIVRSGHMLVVPEFATHFRGSSKQALGSNEVREQEQEDQKQLVPREQVIIAAVILNENLRKTESASVFSNLLSDMVWKDSNSDHIYEFRSVVSRTLHHLQKLDLVTLTRFGREVHIEFISKEALWINLCRLAQPLISHVMTVYCDIEKLENYPETSLSALAHYSDLLQPSVPFYAMKRSQWINWQSESKKPVSISPTAYIEVWKANPGFLHQGRTVNPLFLALNCRRDTDERVRIAIREMLDTLHLNADPLWSI